MFRVVVQEKTTLLVFGACFLRRRVPPVVWRRFGCGGELKGG